MANKKARNLLERALKVIPRATQTMSKCYLMWPEHESFPIFIESQQGCLVKSVDGDEYIDLMGASGTNFMPKSVVESAIKRQLKKGINFSLPSVLETELAELLCDIIPGCEQVRFCKDGSDATMAAVRAARHLKNRDYILMVQNGYHGVSDSFCAVSARNTGVPKELSKYTEKVKYNDVLALEEKLKTGKFAALIIEPVSIEEPKDDYLAKCRSLCDQYDSLLIFDEIVTFGRFALGGCAELFGVVPDLMTIGKCMGSGMAISAVCGKRKYMEAFHDILYSATFAGETLSFAAAIANLKYLSANKKRIYPWVWKCGQEFKQNFNDKCKEFGLKAEALGMAPRLNIKFNYPNESDLKDLWHIEMIKRGILVGTQIYHTPMIEEKYFRRIIKAVNESLEVVAWVVLGADIDQYLNGKRSNQVFKR